MCLLKCPSLYSSQINDTSLLLVVVLQLSRALAEIQTPSNPAPLDIDYYAKVHSDNIKLSNELRRSRGEAKRLRRLASDAGKWAERARRAERERDEAVASANESKRRANLECKQKKEALGSLAALRVSLHGALRTLDEERARSAEEAEALRSEQKRRYAKLAVLVGKLSDGLDHVRSRNAYLEKVNSIRLKGGGGGGRPALVLDDDHDDLSKINL